MKGGVKMKKLACFVLTLAMIWCFAFTAFAADVEEVVPEEDLINDYVALLGVSNSISISGGIATCKYTVDPKAGYKVDVTTVLQRYNGNAWVEVTTWSHDRCYVVDETKTKAVISGYQYRLKTYANVYDSSNNYVEGITAISNTAP
jgi:hypothetical protein